MIRLIARGFWVLVIATSIVLAGTFNTIDPQEYKASIEKLVSGKLGRDITVRSAALEWALPPRIVLRNVRIADRGAAGCAGSGEVVRADRMVAELDVIALTYGRVVAPRVRLERVELALQTGAWPAAGAAGGGNNPSGKAVPVTMAPPFASMLATLGPALGVGEVLVDGLTVIVQNAAGATSTTVVNISGGGGTMIGGGAVGGDMGGVRGAGRPGC